jgi:hypothetical protein
MCVRFLEYDLHELVIAVAEPAGYERLASRGGNGMEIGQPRVDRRARLRSDRELGDRIELDLSLGALGSRVDPRDDGAQSRGGPERRAPSRIDMKVAAGRLHFVGAEGRQRRIRAVAARIT